MDNIKLPSFMKEKRHDKSVRESDLDPEEDMGETIRVLSRTGQFPLSSSPPRTHPINLSQKFWSAKNFGPGGPKFLEN